MLRANRRVQCTGALAGLSAASPRRGISSTGTIDESEIRKFTALADQWWRDADGPFAGLHQMNAVRVPLILAAVRPQQGAPSPSALPLEGMALLDVGCGGGILSEALGRLGARVTGIDASGANVAAATSHVRLDPTLPSRVTYRHTSVEDLAATGASFDCVIASEVLEHVADLDAFLAASAALVRPGGALVATTINRTAPAFALAILAAEYVLRIVPAGTHEWAKFVTPEELGAALAQCGLAQEAVQGFAYSPLAKEWSRTDSTLINYGLVARKAA